MASLSEHFEIVKAALEAAKKDDIHLYIDGVGCGCCSSGIVLNLYSVEDDEQLDFPSDLLLEN